jgi:uncharacterized protein YcbK (DUF882 family)
MQLSTHFSSTEFTCKCGCGKSDVTPELVELLEAIRKYANAPIIVISGRRCERHNKKWGGKLHSQHLLGNAADIHIKGMTPRKAHQFIQELHQSNKCHVGGLGSYSTFTHVDARKDVARWNG